MAEKRFTNKHSWADSILESKKGSVIVGIIAIVFGLFFALTQSVNKPIPRTEAVSYSGEFEKYEREENYKEIFFLDGSSYPVYPHTETQEFADTMSSLPKGTKLYILVNPNNDYVVEIKTESRELLNFEESQAAIDAYDNGYIGIGIFVCFAGVFLIVYGFVSSDYRKMEKAKREKQAKRRTSGVDDNPVRRANSSLKAKILLEARTEDYYICYRRVKSVNELVINGIVYDEKKGIIEFTHNLSAVVDGHTIEAGLSEDSYSYIMFDGQCLANKRRLI